jgi:hypothetical protein
MRINDIFPGMEYTRGYTYTVIHNMEEWNLMSCKTNTVKKRVFCKFLVWSNDYAALSILWI